MKSLIILLLLLILSAALFLTDGVDVGPEKMGGDAPVGPPAIAGFQEFLGRMSLPLAGNPR